MTALRRLAGLLGRLDPARLAVVVSLLPVEVLGAVRVGLDVALARADHDYAELIRADYPGGRYHRQHPLLYATALARRRFPPNGNRDEWIRYGPAGRPIPDTKKAA